MPDRRAETLRALRGETSLQVFLNLMLTHGLAKGSLSRRRLSEIEQGAAAPLALWEEMADALAAAGLPYDAVQQLLVVHELIAPPPPSTSALRLRHWSRIVSRVPGNKWWHRPLVFLATVASPSNAAAYRRMFDEYGGAREQMVEDVRLRLELGRTGGPFTPVPGDGIAVGGAASTLRVQLDHGDPFVLSVRLHNTGTVAWRNRLLLRLGAPVSSSLPLTPGVLPLPDTDPGGHCELIVPGRAQWFPNLAVVSYVMVFPDLSSCLPGRIAFRVDTRTTEFDRSFQLPPGFKPAGSSASDAEGAGLR